MGHLVRKLLLATVAAAVLVGLVTAFASAAAQSVDHFKALGPNKSEASDDALFFPSDFEAAAAAHPDQNSLVFFSRCRRAPFDSPTFYSPFSSTESDAIVNDTTFPLVDGTTCYQPQNEQNIVVNPSDGQNVVTSANDYRAGFQSYVYVSHDGGHTFSNVLLPGWDTATGGTGIFTHVQAGGDPVLAFAPDGTLYFSALVYDFSYPNRTPSGVAVAVSHDGGDSWSKPVMVFYTGTTNYFNDKEWIAAGPGGNVYVTWTNFKMDGHGNYVSSNIVEAVSHNNSATWSEPIPVSDKSHPFDQGSSVALAPNGTLYVAYEGSSSSNVSQDQTILARSTDGGQTFKNTELGRVYDGSGCYPLNDAQGRPRLSFEQFRLNSFPSLGIDLTTGGLAIAWTDDRGNAGCAAGNPGFSGLTNNQVILTTSADGTNWTAPRVITSGGDKVFPAVGANDGRIVVGYYTRDFSPVPTDTDHSCGRAFLNTSDPAYPNSDPVYLANDLNPVCLDYAVSSSTDNFGSETRVSSQSSNPYVEFAGSFIGDYTGVAVNSSGKAYAVWTDNRGNPGVTNPNQDTVVATP